MTASCSSIRRHRPFLILAICGLLGLGGFARWAEASNMRRTAVVAAFEHAAPSVVNIHGRKTVPPDQVVSTDSFRQVNGMGTGVIVDERGYILTNSHVVEGVGRIQVTLDDDSTFVARLIANDPTSDLAVIKISPGRTLPTIKVGTSHDILRGEPVVAIGNAYGYSHTVSEGIVSAVNRTVQISDTQKYENLIQTTASINPGNSGGPLLNVDGEMIGINVAVRVGAQGIGFALPVDDAMDVAAKLMAVERVSRTSHGILAETIPVGQASTELVVRSAPQDSSIEAGDVFVTVGGKPVRRRIDLERRLYDADPGEMVEAKVRRGDDVLTAQISMRSVTSTRSGAVERRAWDMIGVQLATIPSDEFQRLNVEYRGGLRVMAVRAGSPADRFGMSKGDILVGLHKWETLSMDNIAYILDDEEFHRTQPAKFYIIRDGETLFGHLDMRR